MFNKQIALSGCKRMLKHYLLQSNHNAFQDIIYPIEVDIAKSMQYH